MNDDDPKPPSIIKKLFDRWCRKPQTRDDLVGLLRSAENTGLIKTDGLGMLEGVLQVSEMQVRDIMIPRSQMVTINKSASLEETLPIVIDSTHSRFPVIGENRDDVVGILLAKDLLSYSHDDEGKSFNIRDIMRPAVVVPESKRLDILLKEFRLSRNHMAIVADEYGGVAGIVTIEDVLEQIVGEIEDEFDFDEEDQIKQHSTKEYTVKALTPIDEFNEQFNSQLDDNEFDTVGGLISHNFGHLPKRGEVTVIENLQFRILHADHRRIRLLHVTILSTPVTSPDSKVA